MGPIVGTSEGTRISKSLGLASQASKPVEVIRRRSPTSSRNFS